MRGTPEERFWAKVNKTGECWLWQGATLRQGYGQMRGEGGKHILAHRFSYELAHGPIPEHLVCDHLCRRPGCVRPDHIELVSNAENVRRGIAGHRNRNKTHCKSGHPFTPENTHVYPGTRKRRCKTCARRWAAEARRQSRPSTQAA